MREQSIFNPEVRELGRLYISRAKDATLDAAGRDAHPAGRARAGRALEEGSHARGRGLPQFEVWDRSRFDEYERTRAERLPTLFERLSGLGVLAVHVPVLVDEVVFFLRPRDEGWVIDATVGMGGHAEAILSASVSSVRLLGLDTDAAALARARERLTPFGDRVRPRALELRPSRRGRRRRRGVDGARSDSHGSGRVVVAARAVGARVLVPGRRAARHAAGSLERRAGGQRSLNRAPRGGAGANHLRVRRGAARAADRASDRPPPAPGADGRPRGGGPRRGASRGVAAPLARRHADLPGDPHGGQRRARRAPKRAGAGARSPGGRRPSGRHLVSFGRRSHREADVPGSGAGGIRRARAVAASAQRTTRCGRIPAPGARSCACWSGSHEEEGPAASSRTGSPCTPLARGGVRHLGAARGRRPHRGRHQGRAGAHRLSARRHQDRARARRGSDPAARDRGGDLALAEPHRGACPADRPGRGGTGSDQAGEGVRGRWHWPGGRLRPGRRRSAARGRRLSEGCGRPDARPHAGGDPRPRVRRPRRSPRLADGGQAR